MSLDAENDIKAKAETIELYADVMLPYNNHVDEHEPVVKFSPPPPPPPPLDDGDLDGSEPIALANTMVNLSLAAMKTACPPALRTPRIRRTCTTKPRESKNDDPSQTSIARKRKAITRKSGTKRTKHQHSDDVDDGSGSGDSVDTSDSSDGSSNSDDDSKRGGSPDRDTNTTTSMVIFDGERVHLAETTVGSTTIDELVDGKKPEQQQRQWLDTYASLFINRYDKARCSTNLTYGHGEHLVRYFTRMATKDGLHDTGFIMMKKLAPNSGKEQADIMNAIVAVRGSKKEVQRVTGRSHESSAILYRSDKVFSGGVPYVMKHAVHYVDSLYTRISDRSRTKVKAVPNDVRESVSIVMIDPAPMNMARLRRLYLQFKGEPLELGLFDGQSELGDLQPYVDLGVQVHYITQGILSLIGIIVASAHRTFLCI